MKKRYIALFIMTTAAAATAGVYLLKKVFDTNGTAPEMNYAPPATKQDKYEMCDYQKMKQEREKTKGRL